MDKARPSGVIFCDSHAERIIDEKLAGSFTEDRVFLRGVAEEDPVAVYKTDDVGLSPADREPIATPSTKWGNATKMSVADVLKREGFRFYLPRGPRTYESVSVHVEIPGFDQGKLDKTVSTLTIQGDVDEEPNGWVVEIPFDDVRRRLKGIPPMVKTFWGSRPTTVKFTPYIEPGDN